MAENTQINQLIIGPPELKSLTDFKIKNYQEFFINIPKGTFLQSNSLSDKNDTNTSFLFLLFPNGDDGTPNDSITLALKLNQSAELPIRGFISIWTVRGQTSPKQVVINKSVFEFTYIGQTLSENFDKQTIAPNTVPLLNEEPLNFFIEIYYGKLKVEQKFQSKQVLAPTALEKDIAQLYYSPNNTADIQLIVGDKIYQAHICILMARSEYFTAMFRHNMRETQEKTAYIHDIEPDVFKEILRYIYTNEINPTDTIMAAKLMIAADMLQLLDLKNRCKLFVGKN